MLAQAPRAAIEPESIGGIGTVGQQDVVFPDDVEHVLRATAVMGLPGGQLEGGWHAVRIDQRVDLGGQAAARAAHATGSIFFWALAAW